MPSWTHRDRVLAVLAHQVPDRVPLDLMGNASMLLDETYIRLRDHLELPAIAPARSGSTANYYDERILERLDVDFRRIFLPKATQGADAPQEDGSFTDVWGVHCRRQGAYVTAVGHPLESATAVRDIEEHDWPAAGDMFSSEGIAAEARRLSAGDHALVARNPLTAGFLDRCCQLVGMEQFMMMLAGAPELVDCLIGRLLAIYRDVYDLFLDAVGPYVHMVEVGDDLGTSESTLISPAMYRRFIKPADRALYALIRDKAPDAALFRHCDGAIFELIPDLIEVGVDVLNPVRTADRGMAAQRLKEAFGDTLVFHGALEGYEGGVAIEAVEVRVRECIDALGPGGGYIMSSCNHMIDVRPENIIAVFAAAREHGRY